MWHLKMGRAPLSTLCFHRAGGRDTIGVLHSRRAVQVNVAIMRTFIRLRQLLASNAPLARKLEEMEEKYESRFKIVFDAIRELMTPREPRSGGLAFSSVNDRRAMVKHEAKQFSRSLTIH
jgi:hypothetical protein